MDNTKTGKKGPRGFFVSEGRLRWGWRLAVYVAVLIVVYQLLGSRLTEILNGGINAITARGSYQSLLLKSLCNGLIGPLMLVLGTWLCIRFVDRRTMRSFGLSFSKGWLGQLLWGLLLGLVFPALIFIIELVFGWISIKELAWTSQSSAGIALFLTMAVIEALGVALQEEVFARGYLLQTIEQGAGTVWAVVVSSIFFGLMHIPNAIQSGWAIYAAPLTLTLGGVMFTAAYMAKRSLWLPIGLHLSWNLCVFRIFDLAGVKLMRPIFVQTELSGPAFLVGLRNSGFGPEVGLLGVLAIAGITAFVVWKWRDTSSMRKALTWKKEKVGL